MRHSVGVLALFAAAACSGCAHSPVDTRSAENFRAYPVYWVGKRFENLDIRHIDVKNIAFLIYGECDPGPHEGCAPPLEIQVSPLCSHIEIFARGRIQRRIRGAPVGNGPDGAPVLFTNRVQVKVYAEAGLAARAMRALRSINQVEPVLDAQDPIPPAPLGVVEGRRPC